MVRNYKRKTQDRWSKEDLLKALTNIKGGKIKFNDAVRQYGISRATLYRRYQKFMLAGGNCDDVSQFSACGSNPILSKLEEDVLEKTIKDLRDRGYTVKSTDIKRICYEYCLANEIPNQFKQDKGLASDDWYYGFLKRHPNVKMILSGGGSGRKSQSAAQGTANGAAAAGDLDENRGLRRSPRRMGKPKKKGEGPILVSMEAAARHLQKPLKRLSGKGSGKPRGRKAVHSSRLATTPSEVEEDIVETGTGDEQIVGQDQEEDMETEEGVEEEEDEEVDDADEEEEDEEVDDADEEEEDEEVDDADEEEEEEEPQTENVADDPLEDVKEIEIIDLADDGEKSENSGTDDEETEDEGAEDDEKEETEDEGDQQTMVEGGDPGKSMEGGKQAVILEGGDEVMETEEGEDQVEPQEGGDQEKSEEEGAPIDPQLTDVVVNQNPGEVVGEGPIPGEVVEVVGASNLGEVVGGGPNPGEVVEVVGEGSIPGEVVGTSNIQPRGGGWSIQPRGRGWRGAQPRGGGWRRAQPRGGGWRRAQPRGGGWRRAQPRGGGWRGAKPGGRG